MGFKADYSQVNEGVRITPGDYEVIFDSWESKKSQNGNTRIVVDYEIRKDIDQPCKGLKIKFDNFTFVESAYWRFNAASKAAGIPEGTEFQGPEHWAQLMQGRSLKVNVGEREYNGNKYPEVKGFSESAFPVKAQPAPTQSGGYVPIDQGIEDDDLPF